MSYSYSFKPKFANEFANFPSDQQDKILEFGETFEQHGLGDFTKYVGKVSPSWSGNANSIAYNFAQANDLWHYHIGIPTYLASNAKYKTSDWVLHFQWKSRGTHIIFVDLYQHYRYDGSFYLPTADYLTD
jgi:hypothetical protein